MEENGYNIFSYLWLHHSVVVVVFVILFSKKVRTDTCNHQYPQRWLYKAFEVVFVYVCVCVCFVCLLLKKEFVVGSRIKM